MNHAYEIELSPTLRQARQLYRQAHLLTELRQATREQCAQGSIRPIAALLGGPTAGAADRAGAEALLVHTHPRFSLLPVPLLAHSIDLERRTLEREVLLTGTCRSAQGLPRQPALVGPELVRPYEPGYVNVLGVAGPVRADTALLCEVPTVADAWRRDWADLRRETYRWVLELELVWQAYPEGTLMRMWEDSPEDRAGLRRTPEVARLMGWDN